MILFISIYVVICIIIFIAFLDGNVCKPLLKKIGEAIGSCLISAIFYVIVFGIIFMGIGCITVPKEYVYGWSNKIVAIKDNNSYVVSRRSVENQDRYYYMVDYGGYKKTHWVPANNSKIFEVDNGVYEVKTYEEVFKSNNWYQKDMKRFLDIIYSPENLSHEYEFYVPKGTVTNTFELDME
jgi:hypothetical protein